MESGPQNAVVGDTYGIDLPQTQIAKEDLADERRRAAVTRTKEWKDIKAALEYEIELQKRFLPGGQSVKDIPMDEVGPRWVAAVHVIDSLENVINYYERANEVVKEADARSKDA